MLDVNDIRNEQEKIIGDITELDFCRKAVKGMEAVIICHMAGRPYYDTPEVPFDANVKGTANIFHAANEAGINKICLISSIQAVNAHSKNAMYKRLCTPAGSDIYSMTKACQEIIAHSYFAGKGILSSILRVEYVIDAENMKDKYGRDIEKFEPGMIDRSDIGRAAFRSLELLQKNCKTYVLDGGRSPAKYPEIRESFRELGIQPEYRLHNYL